ncbi:unnamed protein product [Vicia faba]|uniref:Uncharacterized protein n=1 Tax=Vicia faba TaxID=3906 RepID=A0AAV0Z7S0_VICFA|nr:unnamed protein product [Vicia faba]
MKFLQLQSNVKPSSLLTPSLICKILKIPDSGIHIFDKEWVSNYTTELDQVLLELYINVEKFLVSSNLKTIPRILHKMIVHNIVPRAGSHEKKHIADITPSETSNTLTNLIPAVPENIHDQTPILNYSLPENSTQAEGDLFVPQNVVPVSTEILSFNTFPIDNPQIEQTFSHSPMFDSSTMQSHFSPHVPNLDLNLVSTQQTTPLDENLDFSSMSSTSQTVTISSGFDPNIETLYSSSH